MLDACIQLIQNTFDAASNVDHHQFSMKKTKIFHPFIIFKWASLKFIESLYNFFNTKIHLSSTRWIGLCTFQNTLAVLSCQFCHDKFNFPGPKFPIQFCTKSQSFYFLWGKHRTEKTSLNSQFGRRFFTFSVVKISEFWWNIGRSLLIVEKHPPKLFEFFSTSISNIFPMHFSCMTGVESIANGGLLCCSQHKLALIRHVRFACSIRLVWSHLSILVYRWTVWQLAWPENERQKQLFKQHSSFNIEHKVFCYTLSFVLSFAHLSCCSNCYCCDESIVRWTWLYI